MADDFVNSLGGAGDQSSGSGPSGGGTNAGSTADILRNQVLSQLTTTLGQVTVALQAAFPQASTNLTTTATAGTQTLPAKPAEFLSITVSGVAYKIPLYLP